MRMKKIFLISGTLFMIFAAGCGKVRGNEGSEEGKKDNVTTIEQPVNTKEPESTMNPENGEELSEKWTVSFKEETDEAKEEDTVYFTSKLYYPFFEGDGAEKMNSFVDTVTTRFREYLPGAKERALMDFHDYSGQDYFRFPEVEELTVNIVMGNEKWLSFYSQWYSDAGGVHPSHYSEAYMVKKEDAQELTIEEFLSGYGVSKEELAVYVAEKMCAETEFDLKEVLLVESLPDAVSDFLDGHQWYLTEEELVVFANPYDVAPYVYGLISCKISFEDLEQGLKK
ncbi:MAG: DUF3298 domain-containing protein [Lachnospiraceae bacterium]|nr:DUF3298 domain-containing protein [Lachnospiraceae bacterium]